MYIASRTAASNYPTPRSTPPNGVAALDDDPTGITVLVSSRAIVDDQETPATLVLSALTGTFLAVYTSVLPPSSFAAGTRYVDHSPLVLLPGLVDAHVHLNEPGRTEWEGFWHGTRAAAFGGVTCVVDMPLNAIPPTTTVANLREKVAAAQGKCWVDVGFYGGAVPGNAHELPALVAAGVRGFKGFLIDSGVPEFPALAPADVAAAMRALADEPTVLMFHAEMLPHATGAAASYAPTAAAPVPNATSHDPNAAPHALAAAPTPTPAPADAYSTFLASRPPAFETRAIETILALAPLAPRLPLHIVHLSAVEAIPLLRAARAAGVRISAETCPHYLTLAAEAIPDGDTRHKCCPPIRGAANQAALWAELLAGPAASVLAMVVSDHSPCTPALKLLPAPLAADASPPHPAAGDFAAAWGGIASVGLSLPLLWTAAHAAPAAAGLTLPALARLLCAAPAAHAGLAHRKGALAPGLDADVAVFDPDAVFALAPAHLLFRNKITPYAGRRLRGVVRETWLRGRRVFVRDADDGAALAEAGFGEKLGPIGECILERRTA